MFDIVCKGKTLWDFHLIGEVLIVENDNIISEENCRGRIIVTHTPSPDIVLNMKCALAIVTETGGVLCHAAVLALELGCPIIVAAEGVRKHLNDGDVVVLSGERGEGIVYAERTV